MDRHRLDARPASVLNPMPVALSVDLQFHYRNRVRRKIVHFGTAQREGYFFCLRYDHAGVVVSVTRFGISCELNNFRRIFDKVSLTADDYAVVMTPGHQADYEILEQVLRTPATYIGCIGSRNKAAKTRDLLRQEGFSEEAIASVHLPIGLPILAQTPAEIAISIAGEMIRCRAEAAQKR